MSSNEGQLHSTFRQVVTFPRNTSPYPISEARVPGSSLVSSQAGGSNPPSSAELITPPHEVKSGASDLWDVNIGTTGYSFLSQGNALTFYDELTSGSGTAVSIWQGSMGGNLLTFLSEADANSALSSAAGWGPTTQKPTGMGGASGKQKPTGRGEGSSQWKGPPDVADMILGTGWTSAQQKPTSRGSGQGQGGTSYSQLSPYTSTAPPQAPPGWVAANPGKVWDPSAGVNPIWTDPVTQITYYLETQGISNVNPKTGKGTQELAYVWGTDAAAMAPYQPYLTQSAQVANYNALIGDWNAFVSAVTPGQGPQFSTAEFNQKLALSYLPMLTGLIGDLQLGLNQPLPAGANLQVNEMLSQAQSLLSVYNTNESLFQAELAQVAAQNKNASDWNAFANAFNAATTPAQQIAIATKWETEFPQLSSEISSIEGLQTVNQNIQSMALSQAQMIQNEAILAQEMSLIGEGYTPKVVTVTPSMVGLGSSGRAAAAIDGLFFTQPGTYIIGLAPQQDITNGLLPTTPIQSIPMGVAPYAGSEFLNSPALELGLSSYFALHPNAYAYAGLELNVTQAHENYLASVQKQMVASQAPKPTPTLLTQVGIDLGVIGKEIAAPLVLSVQGWNEISSGLFSFGQQKATGPSPWLPQNVIPGVAANAGALVAGGVGGFTGGLADIFEPGSAPSLIPGQGRFMDLSTPLGASEAVGQAAGDIALIAVLGSELGLTSAAGVVKGALTVGALNVGVSEALSTSPTSQYTNLVNQYQSMTSSLQSQDAILKAQEASVDLSNQASVNAFNAKVKAYNSQVQSSQLLYQQIQQLQSSGKAYGSTLLQGKLISPEQAGEAFLQGAIFGAVLAPVGAVANEAIGGLAGTIGGTAGTDFISSLPGRMLTNIAISEAITLPFSRDPEALGINAILGAGLPLAGDLGGAISSRVGLPDFFEAGADQFSRIANRVGETEIAQLIGEYNPVPAAQEALGDVMKSVSDFFTQTGEEIVKPTLETIAGYNPAGTVARSTKGFIVDTFRPGYVGSPDTAFSDFMRYVEGGAPAPSLATTWSPLRPLERAALDAYYGYAPGAALEGIGGDVLSGLRSVSPAEAIGSGVRTGEDFLTAQKVYLSNELANLSDYAKANIVPSMPDLSAARDFLRAQGWYVENTLGGAKETLLPGEELAGVKTSVADIGKAAFEPIVTEAKVAGEAVRGYLPTTKGITDLAGTLNEYNPISRFLNTDTDFLGQMQRVYSEQSLDNILKAMSGVWPVGTEAVPGEPHYTGVGSPGWGALEVEGGPLGPLDIAKDLSGSSSFFRAFEEPGPSEGTKETINVGEGGQQTVQLQKTEQVELQKEETVQETKQAVQAQAVILGVATSEEAQYMASLQALRSRTRQRQVESQLQILAYPPGTPTKGGLGIVTSQQPGASFETSQVQGFGETLVSLPSLIQTESYGRLIELPQAYSFRAETKQDLLPVLGFVQAPQFRFAFDLALMQDLQLKTLEVEIPRMGQQDAMAAALAYAYITPQLEEQKMKPLNENPFLIVFGPPTFRPRGGKQPDIYGFRTISHPLSENPVVDAKLLARAFGDPIGALSGRTSMAFHQGGSSAASSNAGNALLARVFSDPSGTSTGSMAFHEAGSVARNDSILNFGTGAIVPGLTRSQKLVGLVTPARTSKSKAKGLDFLLDWS